MAKTSTDVKLKWMGGLKFDVNIRGKHNLFVDASSETQSGGDEGPAPDDMLTAAVGSCLASSFVFCASKVKAELASLTVTARAEISRVEGYLRVTGLDVTLNPQFKEEEPSKKQDRCIAIFRNYCTVTESVTRGIPVKVNIKT
ncbi:MAG: OsmC family protein [Candidatus Jordarchaeum sp.]|uniref:OsmC family protein n=1 Tax=Candidatus Jordarchaeum sp. TaxID=2823881 RepID=UPI00404A3D7F